MVGNGGLMATKQWSSTAPPGEFHPYVEAGESVAEFSLRAVILGSLFGVLFGAVSVYVGLRAGLTVSASIPIACFPSASCARSGVPQSWKIISCRPPGRRASQWLPA